MVVSLEHCAKSAAITIDQAPVAALSQAVRAALNAAAESSGSDPQSAALRHVILAERAAAKLPELQGIAPREITRAAVIGGGTMGTGIAMALLNAGLPVILVERSAEAAQRSLAKVRRSYDSAVERNRISPADRNARLAGLTPSTDFAAVAEADVIIEAVFEDLAVKNEVFAALEPAVKPDAVLASNTSYLDPEAIAARLSRPERFLGLHFFNPAQVMKLVEVIRTPATALEALATAFALISRLGKIAVVAGICDGFIGNRILKVYRRQAERLLLDGCQPAEVDRALRGFGLPMGPFEAQDLGGLDIAGAQRKAARARGETVFAPIADRLCALGRFGRKTGAGWYDYADGDRSPRPSETVAAVIAEEVEKTGRARQRPANETLCRRVLYPMVDEAARILDEGIARSAGDIDLVEIHGYGFPRRRGGLMFFAEQIGLDKIIEELEIMAQQGCAEAPCDFLRKAAATGGFAVPHGQAGKASRG